MFPPEPMLSWRFSWKIDGISSLKCDFIACLSPVTTARVLGRKLFRKICANTFLLRSVREQDHVMRPQPFLPPTRRTVGVVGIHGFARIHLEHLLRLRDAGVIDRVLAVAHQADLDPAWVASLQQRGVVLVQDLTELLTVERPALVTLPVGIALHVPMAEQALDQGIPVYVEKPVAGSLAQFDRLARHPQAHLVQVGFQHLALPGVRTLAARLQAGDFGRLRRIVVTCGWPRGDVYYHRNAWAGRVVHHGEIIRDSPANNANAHHVNLALFLAGRPVTRVETTLGRGNPIESFDTCGIRAVLTDDVEVVFNASHLGLTNLGVRIRVECDQAIIRCDDLDGQPAWRTDTGEAFLFGGDADRQAYAQAIDHVLTGAAPVCTLAEARPHGALIEAVHQQTIQSLAGCERRPDRWCHPGMDAALLRAHAEGCPLRFEDLEAGWCFPPADYRCSA